MPVGPLVLLNGPPPGIGKSTLARLLVQEHPLALSLDIDLLRRSLGRWDDGTSIRTRVACWREASPWPPRAPTWEASRRRRVPQFLGRLAFVERLEALARDEGAAFAHVVLMDSRDNAIARFLTRVSAPDIAEQHRHTAAMAGGAAGLGQMYDDLLAVLAARPAAIVVPSVEGDLEGTYLRLREALTGRL